MATRFYLPASGTPPLSALAKNAAWELETGIVRLPTKITKQNTALATSTRTWPATTTQQWCWYQYQSEQLLAAYSWTTADTVSMVLGKLAETTTAGDTHLNYNIRVVSQDGTVIRGIIGALQATAGSEFLLIAAAATKIFNAATTGATNFSSQIGDRIIIEIGVHGVTPALENIQFRIGDPTATADFALTAGLTTDLCSWVELSRTVTFGAAVAIIEAATGADSSSAVFTGLAAIIESATATESIDGNVIISASITESLTATDTSNGVTDIIHEVSIIEVISAEDVSQANYIALVSKIEAVTSEDINTGASILLSSITEAVSATDQEDGIIVIEAAINESISAIDSLSAAVLYSGIIEESLAVEDYNASVFIGLAGITEPLIAEDTSNGGLFFTAGIEESGTLADSAAASSLYEVSISEVVAEGGGSDMKYWDGAQWKAINTLVVYL